MLVSESGAAAEGYSWELGSLPFSWGNSLETAVLVNHHPQSGSCPTFLSSPTALSD